MTDRVEATSRAVDEVLAKADRAVRLGRKLTAAALVLLLAMSLSFGIITIGNEQALIRRLQEAVRDNQRALTILQQQTSPATEHANQQKLAQIEGFLISCENNHVDRVVAAITHRPVPPLGAGCPADSIGVP